MRHRRRVKHFNRKPTARKALIRGLVRSLVEHGRITTTVEKAKEVRRHVEKAITLGKKATLNSRRVILAKYPNKDTVETIMSDLAPRFKTRAGGYTRIIKIGRRPGDTAEMAFLEFVDFDFAAKAADAEKTTKTEETKKTTKKTATATTAKPKKAKKAAAGVVAKKKSAKKIQKKSRAAARA